jgi:hypothetical protein
LEQQGKNENFNAKWRDIAPVGFVLLVAFVALVAFHRCSGLGKSLSNDCYAMVGTTLLAAVLGFGAIWHQTRSSYRQLREQVAAQRDAEREETERQRKSLARAFLFEIEDFYHYGVKRQPDWETFEESQIPHRVVKFRRWPFVMYEANAGRIGGFDDRTTKSIIKFYGDAEAYQASVEEFVVSSAAARSGSDTARLEARALLGRLKEIFPALKRSAESVCATLSNVAGVPREDLRVPVSDFQDEGERKEMGRKPEHDA